MVFTRSMANAAKRKEQEESKDWNAILLENSKNGSLQNVKQAVEGGADIEAKNNYGSTALLAAANDGHLDIVKYLIEQKADIEADDSAGRTALLLTAEDGNLACQVLD